MDFETILALILRYTYYFVYIVVNSRKACKALSKGWAAFTEFIRSLDGYKEGEQPPPPPQNIIIVPLTDELGMTGQAPCATVQLTGLSLCSSGGRLIGSLS